MPDGIAMPGIGLEAGPADALGHFQTVYENTEGLLRHFTGQLEKLAANGFIEFKRDDGPGAPGATNYQATLSGNGAIAQGKGANAAGQGAVIVNGDNTASINMGVITTFPILLQQAERPGATPADLRLAYLAWIGMRANELPLFAGDSGERIPVEVRAATAAQGFAPAAPALRSNPEPQRAYPWGSDWAPDNANAEMNVGSTSSPGCFDSGCSPYGCEDMAGNVWEWTRSLWGKDRGKPEFTYPYLPLVRKREDLSAGDDVLRLVRGGSWLNHRDDARCAVHGRYRPDYRLDYVGFRVVLRSAPVPDSEL